MWSDLPITEEMAVFLSKDADAVLLALSVGYIGWINTVGAARPAAIRAPSALDKYGLTVVMAVLGLIGLWLTYMIAGFATKEQSVVDRITSDPFLIIPFLTIGVFLYRLRGKNPVVYGFFELLVAASVIVYVVISYHGDFLAKSMAICSGVYITVRGLDNIEKGLNDLDREHWRYTFPVRPRTAGLFYRSVQRKPRSKRFRRK